MRRITIRLLFFLLVAVLGFELMTTAFHLLNQPSDKAVYGGMVLLVCDAVVVCCATWFLWRRL